jgi:hypothetical protein
MKRGRDVKGSGLVDPGPEVGGGKCSSLYRLLEGGLCIAERRRRNYRSLSERLADVALIPSLLEGVVPIGFPVQIPERNEVRAMLIKKGIFPAYIGP